MDRKMMNAWLAEQAKKAQITEAQMQRKRLGINEDSMVKDVPVTRKNEPKVPAPLPGKNDPMYAGQGSSERQPAGYGSNQGLNDMRSDNGGFSDDSYTKPSATSEFAKMNPSKRPAPKPQPVSEAAVRNKILGVVPQAEARNKAGESATTASTPITEQLNAEEEKYAKEHKSMLAGMIKQYGKEKGTRVFYGTVRNKVRGK